MTIDSIPFRFSRCESIRPAGPAPTIPTCVRIDANSSDGANSAAVDSDQRTRYVCGQRTRIESRDGAEFLGRANASDRDGALGAPTRFLGRDVLTLRGDGHKGNLPI